MLSRLVCQNYRALNDFEIEFDPLTVLVGPNGAGKSTVLRAVDFILGTRWPAVSQMDVPNDFTNLDNSQSLRIQAFFEPTLTHEDALNKIHDVGSIQFTCQPYKRKTGDKVPGDLRDIYEPLSPEGKQLSVCVRRPQAGQRPVFQPLTSVGGGLREQARVLSITRLRTINSQQPGRRGSVLRGLLEEARRSFLRNETGERTSFKEQYQKAIETLRTAQVKSVEAAIEETARRMVGFHGFFSI